MIGFIEEYKEQIDTIAGIGSFIASIIAIFTLREVILQRRSMYKPLILIKSFIVSINKSPLNKQKDELLTYRLSIFNDYSKNFKEIEFDHSPKYKVDNLGFGVASEVKCEWIFDHEQAAQLVKQLLNIDYILAYEKTIKTYYLRKLSDNDFHYSAYTDHNIHTINYIPPIEKKDHSHYHVVPKMIIYFHYLFLLFKLDLLKSDGKAFHTFDFDKYAFPKPKIEISYKDLNGKSYKKTYKFSVSSVSLQFNENINLNEEFAYLHFEIK